MVIRIKAKRIPIVVVPALRNAPSDGIASAMLIAKLASSVIKGIAYHEAVFPAARYVWSFAGRI
jgi:hypothetical protein